MPKKPAAVCRKKPVIRPATWEHWALPECLTSLSLAEAGFPAWYFRTLDYAYGWGHTRIMKRTTIWLKAIQIRELKAIARETGATVAGLIRKAIDEFIGHHKAEKAKVEVNGAKNEKSE